MGRGRHASTQKDGPVAGEKRKRGKGAPGAIEDARPLEKASRTLDYLPIEKVTVEGEEYEVNSKYQYRDEEINAILKLMLEKHNYLYNGKPIMALAPIIDVVIPRMVKNQLGSIEPTGAGSSLSGDGLEERLRTDKASHSAERILVVPCNLANYHWVVCIFEIDKENKCINAVYMDSQGNAPNEVFRKQLCNVYPEAPAFIQPEGIILQTDGTSCGACALHNIERYLFIGLEAPVYNMVTLRALHLSLLKNASRAEGRVVEDKEWYEKFYTTFYQKQKNNLPIISSKPTVPLKQPLNPTGEPLSIDVIKQLMLSLDDQAKKDLLASLRGSLGQELSKGQLKQLILGLDDEQKKEVLDCLSALIQEPDHGTGDYNKRLLEALRRVVWLHIDKSAMKNFSLQLFGVSKSDEIKDFETYSNKSRALFEINNLIEVYHECISTIAHTSTAASATKSNDETDRTGSQLTTAPIGSEAPKQSGVKVIINDQYKFLVNMDYAYNGHDINYILLGLNYIYCYVLKSFMVNPLTYTNLGDNSLNELLTKLKLELANATTPDRRERRYIIPCNTGNNQWICIVLKSNTAKRCYQAEFPQFGPVESLEQLKKAIKDIFPHIVFIIRSDLKVTNDVNSGVYAIESVMCSLIRSELSAEPSSLPMPNPAWSSSIQPLEIKMPNDIPLLTAKDFRAKPGLNVLEIRTEHLYWTAMLGNAGSYKPIKLQFREFYNDFYFRQRDNKPMAGPLPENTPSTLWIYHQPLQPPPPPPPDPFTLPRSSSLEDLDTFLAGAQNHSSMHDDMAMTSAMAISPLFSSLQTATNNMENQSNTATQMPARPITAILASNRGMPTEGDDPLSMDNLLNP